MSPDDLAFVFELVGRTVIGGACGFAFGALVRWAIDRGFR